MPPTGCWPACPSSCRLSSRCLSPACRFAISLPDICPHPVCVPAAHPLDSAPHPLYTIYTTKCPQKCTKQNAISRKRNTARLYAACLYVCMPPTGCGLHAHPPAAYLPGTCLLRSFRYLPSCHLFLSRLCSCRPSFWTQLPTLSNKMG